MANFPRSDLVWRGEVWPDFWRAVTVDRSVDRPIQPIAQLKRQAEQLGQS